MVEYLYADKCSRVELLFILLFAYMRRLKAEQLRKAANAMAEKAKQVRPALVK